MVFSYDGSIKNCQVTNKKKMEHSHILTKSKVREQIPRTNIYLTCFAVKVLNTTSILSLLTKIMHRRTKNENICTKEFYGTNV